MKTYYSKIEEELDQIRLKIYEETKDLTPEQLAECDRKKNEEYRRKYNFKYVENAFTMEVVQ